MIPEILIATVKKQVQDLSRYEEMCLDGIKGYEEKLIEYRTQVETYRKQRSELTQFLEENGIS